MRLRIACPLAFLAVLAGPAAGQVPAEERLCLADYLRVRNDPAQAIQALRKCAQQFPDSYQIQRTYALKLAEEVARAAPLDAELAAEACLHLKKAGDLEPARFGSDWRTLGELLVRLGRQDEAIQAFRAAEPFLTPSERQDLQDQLWTTYRDAGDTEKALAVWDEVWHRHEDDFDDQLAAGRMLREVGRLPEAKDRLRRATELRRDDASARKAYVDVLLRLAETGTAADQKELVAVFLPQLASTDEELLGRLLVMALDTFSAEAAQSLADEILKRDPDAALPSLVKAEALLSAGNADAALAAARKALSGSLAASQAARAHALVGRVVAEQAYKAYTSAGDRTSKTLVDATSARYREALASLRRAAEAGLDVARDVENVERALEALGGAQAEYRDRQVEAARAECVQLGPQARLAYDRDRPLATTAAADVTLAVSAGREPQGGRIPSGATVSLRDASWVGGACWVEVRAQDGTSGWAKQSSFR